MCHANFVVKDEQLEALLLFLRPSVCTDNRNALPHAIVSIKNRLLAGGLISFFLKHFLITSLSVFFSAAGC